MTGWPRVPHGRAVNALTHAIAALRARGASIADLTLSNPTRAALSYPDDLLAPLADPAALRYDPEPLGLRSAREAIAADAARRGVTLDPAHVVLSASTSEAYSWIFKLLCAPGDGVLVPRPSYPLFEHLTALEGVACHTYPLEWHGRWEIDLDGIRAAPANTRAVLVVSPNNPTGSFIGRRERDQLQAICRDRGWALVADEVFVDYPLDVDGPCTDLAVDANVLTFSLGGASKALGLPQVKLAWTVVGGPAATRDAALDALELIADTFLSVNTPIQVAAPGLLQRGAGMREAIRQRVRGNLESARAVVREWPACTLLPVEGGWSAVMRVPATRSEEALVLDLLAHERVLVHPGYFFDFAHEAFVVISLLPEPPVFVDALARAMRYLNG